jgi:Sulfatase
MREAQGARIRNSSAIAAPAGIRVRFFAFASLTLIPFWRFLAANQYNPLSREALAGALLFGLQALLLAWILRGRWFYAGLLCCSVVLAAHPLRALLAPIVSVNVWAAALGVAALLTGTMRILRDRFPTVLVVFACALLGADGAKLAAQAFEERSAPSAAKPGHLLYLILDEHLGLAGFPQECPACVNAQRTVLATLRRHGFTVYPNAYSNYSSTLDSIPSILNRELLTKPDEFSSGRTPGGAVIVAPVQLFRWAAERGYAVHVYQHRSIDYAAANPQVARYTDYSSVLGGLDEVPGWKRRFLWLVGSYQGSDPALSAVRAFLPFRLAYRYTGPLAVRSVWPGRLAEDIIGAPRKTLFFAHLMIPHDPDLYRSDGSVRPYADWIEDRPGQRLDQAAYEEHYERYCEQVEFLSHQVDGFLSSLERAGILSSMTVVIHGDHGSRIRLLPPGAPPDPITKEPHPDRYDLNGPPALQDLLDRFSTLLAIRKPGPAAPSIVTEKHSVLSFLMTDFYAGQAQPVSGADSVYLFDSNRFAHEIPITFYWR